MDTIAAARRWISSVVETGGRSPADDTEMRADPVRISMRDSLTYRSRTREGWWPQRLQSPGQFAPGNALPDIEVRLTVNSTATAYGRSLRKAWEFSHFEKCPRGRAAMQV